MVIDFDFYREELKKVNNDVFKPSKPTSWKTLKNKCVAYRSEWLENANAPETDSDKWKIKKLSELAVAQGVDKLCHVITLPNGRVAIYDPDEGYYHKDPNSLIKLFIF